jgi:hypothetical protein
MPYTNNHEYVGSVINRSQVIPYGTKGGNKMFLYCEGDYISKGKITKVQAKFVCFGHESSRNKGLDVFPGDVIKFNFRVSGWYQPEEKDYFNAPKCYTDAVVDSPIEIVNTSQRRLYDNGIEPKKDDLGTFDTPKVKLGDPDADDPANDLPFSWLIPFLLPLAANFIL